ncbi:hypothetical protein FS749_012784 [Ceratobasidium sp. UAMH 11750]|nr:hypothetical protein FS749_012784 [Ceratobasidium sp. UAMH 11750]
MGRGLLCSLSPLEILRLLISMNLRDFLIVAAVAAALAYFSRIVHPSRTRPRSPLRLTVVGLNCCNPTRRIGQRVRFPLRPPLPLTLVLSTQLAILPAVNRGG